MNILATFKRGLAFEARVVLTEFNGGLRLDCRTYYTKADGTLAPTTKGVAFLPEEIPALMAALAEAQAHLEATAKEGAL